MSFLSVLIVAVGLAMDAFAVSIAAGLKLGCVTGRQTFRLSFHFGFFQFIMPIVGWFGGRSVVRFISAVDHWIAMGLLGFIGGKMIYEALIRGHESQFRDDPTTGPTLLMLSVATSIDALALGLSLCILEASIIYPSIVIGLVAAGFTVLGLRIGCKVGERFSRNMEIAGGILLIAIGVKIVIDHLL